MMKWIQYSKAAAIAMSIGLLLFACEEFAEETYELSATDELAVAAMGDTLEISLNLKSTKILQDGSGLGVILYHGGADTVLMAVDSNALTLANIYAALDSAGITPFTPNDTAYAVSKSDDSLAYRVLSIAESGKYVLYLNHHYYENLYTAGSLEKVAVLADNMSPELIANLYDLPGPVPVIKSRYEYQLDAGNYLFEVARTETTTDTDFRVVLIREQ